jgi:hypothetical protein
MFICFVFLVGIILFKSNINEQKIYVKNKYSGLDERQMDNKSDVDINTIRGYFFKSDLLKLLESDVLEENQKLSMIYNLAFFDDLNPNVIKAPNFSKGLKW